MEIDGLDARIIALLTERPGLPIIECGRRLRVARATVQARLDRLRRSGVIASEAPTVDPGALGFPIRSFCAIRIEQAAGHRRVAGSLARIPEIVELHTVTGEHDLLATVVASGTADLQRVIDEITRTRGVARLDSRLLLESHLVRRTLPLVESAAGGSG